MLLCSCCDSGWLLSCLQPALEAVPDGEWLCPARTELQQPAAVPRSPEAHIAPVLITIAGQPLAWVSQLKYLGSMHSSHGGLEAKLSYRCR